MAINFSTGCGDFEFDAMVIYGAQDAPVQQAPVNSIQRRDRRRWERHNLLKSGSESDNHAQG